MTTAETIEGVVEATNERGLRLAGDWLNVSKFRPLKLPDVGSRVRVGKDPKGFIATLEVLEHADSKLSESPNRDQRIARLAVLKAAAYFCGQRATVHEDVKSPTCS